MKKNYGSACKNTYVSKCPPEKRRCIEPSLKAQYQCPFILDTVTLAFLESQRKHVSFIKLR